MSAPVWTPRQIERPKTRLPDRSQRRTNHQVNQQSSGNSTNRIPNVANCERRLSGQRPISILGFLIFECSIKSNRVLVSLCLQCYRPAATGRQLDGDAAIMDGK